MPANQYLQPFFDSLSQGVQVAQHLNQAAIQHQQLQEAQREFNARQALQQQEFGLSSQLDKANLVGQGATPVDSSGNVNAPAPQPVQTTNAAGVPSTTLANTGQSAAVPADASKPTVSVGGSTLEVPTLQDKLQQQISSQQQVEAATYPTAKQVFGDLLPNGADPNLRFPINQAGSVLAGRAYGQAVRGEQQQPQDPTKTITKQQIERDDKGNLTAVNSFADGHVEAAPVLDKQGKQVKGQSDKFGNGGEAGGGAGRQLTPDAILATRNKALEDYQKAGKEESGLEQESLALGTALKSGQHYVDKNGNLKRFDPAATPEEVAAQQDDMRNRLTTVQKRIQEVIAEKNDAMQRYGTKPQVSTQQAQQAIQSGMAPQQGGAAPAKTSRQGGQPTKKVATKANVQAYAAQKGISSQQAQQEFAQAGWTVQ